MCALPENKIYIIKMKNQANALDRFRDYLNASKGSGNPRAYYNLTDATSPHDRSVFNDMKANTQYRCALLDYSDDEITCLYWATCEKYSSQNITSIHCRLKYKSEDKAIIENFVYHLQLNLEKDFPENSYINFEISSPLMQQMLRFETAPYQQSFISREYKQRPRRTLVKISTKK